jgi:hypothetical protein
MQMRCQRVFFCSDANPADDRCHAGGIMDGSVNERFSFAWQPWTLMVCECGSAFCSSRSKNFAIASADFFDYLP